MSITFTKWNKIALIIVGVFLLLVIITLAVLLPLLYRGEKLHAEDIAKVVEAVPTRELEIKKNNDGFYTIRNDETNKPFKILQLTDIHVTNGKYAIEQDSKALSAVANLVTESQPDLVIITGDLIYPILSLAGTSNNMKAAEVVGSLFEKLGVPWVLTYGNHDAEIGYTHSKSALSKYFESLEHCLFVKGDKDVDGEGNAYIELLNNDGSINQVLFLIDSHAYDIQGYDKIHDNQVEWYTNTAANLKARWGEYKSLAFFHIPLEAYKLAWAEYEDNSHQDTANVQWNTDLNKETNKKEENVCSPNKEGNMFQAILDAGVTQGVFVGHDHYNNFSLKYKGIMLTYAQSIDYIAYGDKIFRSTWQRGGTEITINGDNSFNIAPLLLTSFTNTIHIA